MVKKRHKHKKTRVDFVQFSNKVKPGLKMGLLWLVVLLGLFLLREFWIGWKHSIWDGKSYFAFVYESDGQVGYVGVNKELEEVVYLNFVDQLEMPLADGYGDYQVSKIDQLAELEKIKYGELLKDSVTQYLGVVVDGYVVKSNVQDADINWMLLKSLFKIAKTNLSSWDLIRLLMFTRNLRNEQIKVIDLADTDILFEKELPDKSIVFETDYDLLDNLVLKQFSHADYLADDNTWEIYNGTFHDGFGAQMKRLVANSGFDVVGVRQENDEQSLSAIEVQEENMTDNIREFADELGIPVVFHSDSSRRSTVRLVLGEDYWQRCCTRH